MRGGETMEERRGSDQVGVLPRFDWTVLGRPVRPTEPTQLTIWSIFFRNKSIFIRDLKDKVIP
jgi:hypothetical protein